jgi:lipoprotein-anchoring transpeptidase ErfK/SrfK
MFVRVSRKGVFVAVAAVWASAGYATGASAQGVPGWSPWDGPQRADPPGVSQPDDERYDDRYNGGYDSRDEQRNDDRRSDDRNYDDQRNDVRRYDDRRYDDDRGLSDRNYEDRGYDGRDDYDDREAPPEVQAQRSNVPGVDGGPRPVIQPVAPPVVTFSGPYAPGSIVIDTGARKLYYVMSPTSAFAYPIGVGRQGFAWTGTEKVSRVTDWPDWFPPADMRQRKPGLPERMLGGIRNPLGIKAIYLGNTLYRIHGTNEPKSIGKAESSGCFRMMNENVLHLASLVKIGTPVTVVHSLGGGAVAASTTSRRTWSERPPQPRWDNRDYEPYPDDMR